MWTARDHAMECGEREVGLTFSRQTNEVLLPGAMAYALPYADGGLRITIFLDRLHPVLARNPNSRGAILGHVIAHEVVHVVQGIKRHSDLGLMKGRWSEDDFQKMGVKAMGLTPSDRLLVPKRPSQCNQR